MKYKVGDKVRIKSLDWYNENKASDDEIRCHPIWFGKEHSKYCGQIMTISDVREDLYYMIEDDGDDTYAWTDEMIECLVERNGKTYSYKIGDRVILKGNNRCATITDLKYNSWGNLSYYIKIDNDNDISIDYPTDLLLPYDNMVEGLAEDESKNTDVINRENYIKAEVNKYFQEYMNSLCKEHDEMIEGLMKDGTIIDYVKESNDRYRIVIDPRFDIEVDEGEYYAVRRKKEYPKTYKECRKIMGVDTEFLFTGYDLDLWKGHLLSSLQKLLICRDAYWKLYGEEMGLGKSWEPGETKLVYPITRYGTQICTHEEEFGMQRTFEFPTEQMRDAFYENFKEEIEICKEFL